MKNAALEYIWRNAQTTPAGTSILGFSLEELKGINGKNLSFEGPLVAICGFNGTGKTTLLNSLQALLGGGSRATTYRTDERIQSARVHATLKFRGKTHDLMKAAGDSKNMQVPADLVVHFFNPTYDSVTLQRTLQERDDITALMNGIEGQTFGVEELEEVSRIVGKKYSSIIAFDLSQEFRTTGDNTNAGGLDLAANVDAASSAIEELPMLDLKKVPFFQVMVGDVKYDSRSMGLGELATVFLYWSLQSVPKGAIVLLEEPESFITPASQPALGAVLAKFASENKFTIIFTSHSEPLVSRLSAKNLIINVPQVSGVSEAMIAEDMDEHLHALRLHPRKLGMIFCEDWGGVAFLRGLLRRRSHTALSRFDFIPAFGEGNVAKLLGCYPRKGGVTPILGVLDGDVRNSFADKGMSWPSCFLPGDVAPEKILIEKFKDNLDQFCDEHDVRKRSLQMVISGSEGLDYHDVISHITKTMPFTHEDIVNFVVRRLSVDCDWEEEIIQFFKSLDNCLESIE